MNFILKKSFIVTIMKISIIPALLLFFAICSYASTSEGQVLLQKKVSLNLQNKTVAEVLQDIEDKQDVKFIYSPELINASRKVNMNAVNKELNSILTELFDASQISFEENQRYILLSKKDKQDIVVSGKVSDQTGPIPGVSVLVKGTQNGTVTNSKGEFSLRANDANAILVFSFIGYVSQERAASAGSFNIILKEEASNLNEVVVVGYGTQKKSDLTGSVATVSEKDFNKGSITSPQDLVVGKIPGVVITSGGGAPGTGSAIRIRGGSSLSASNDPLIVIDGVPIDNNGISGLANPLSTINPNDIETFTVLKDASATAIYGSRASNGVILITTKKGGKSLVISYSGNVSAYTLPKTVSVLSGDEYRGLITSRLPSNANLLGKENTDWQNEIYETAFGQDHNLSISGPSKITPYRLSLGYTDQNGILKTSSMDRKTAALSLNPSYLKDHLKINLNAKGSSNLSRFAETGAINSAILMDPTQPVKNGGAYQEGYFAWLTGTNLNALAPANPVAQLLLTDNHARINRFIGNIQGDYKMHFLPDLRANLNLAYDHSKTNGSKFIPAGTSFTSAFEGSDGIYTQTKKNELLEFYLNYAKDLKSIDSRIDITGGYSHQHFYQEAYSKTTNASRKTVLSESPSKTQNYLISFFGRLNYTYADRYLLTMTLRDDGSSRFAPQNRWGLFPSAAFAWRIKNESFLKGNTVISDLKLRLGYGKTGQQDIGEDYPYLAKFTMSSPDQTAQYQFGDTFYNTLRPAGYDEDIRWESTTNYNAGLDFGLFNGRLNGALDFYIRKTTDLLNRIPVPAGTNLTNQLITNVGNMENRGIEFSLNANVLRGDHISWDIAYNIGYNKNKITKLTQTNDPKYIGVQTGGISGSSAGTIAINSIGYPVNSFYVYKQIYDGNGQPVEGKYEDLNGDGIVNSSDLYRYKQAAAKVLMGLSSRFSYGNWDASFSGRLSLGNYIYNNISSSYGTYFDLYSLGALKNVPTVVSETSFKERQLFSDYYVQKASFFRMDNISIGYSFRNVFRKDQVLHVNGGLQNAFVITPYKGLDPEVFNGIDNTVYPRPRTFVLGASLSF